MRKCPTCSSTTTVVDSRDRPDGSVRRRRECRYCKARFTTVEDLAENVPGPARMKELRGLEDAARLFTKLSKKPQRKGKSIK